MKGRPLTRRRALGSLSAGTVVALAGCSVGDILVGAPEDDRAEGTTDGSGQPSTDGSDADTLTLGLIEGPRGFDPISIDHVPSKVVYQHIFEGLYEYDTGIEPRPRLASGPPEIADGGRHWTVELRTGPRFQNGEPVRPNDVRYSFEAPVEERTDVRPIVRDIEQITVADDSRVEFLLERPDPGFRHTLTRPIVPEAERERDPTAFEDRNPVGSGPFEFVGRADGGSVRLRAWSDYWGDRTPNLNELVYRFDDRDIERLSRFTGGSADVVELGTKQAWQTASDTADAHIAAVPRLVYYYLAFNCREGPTTDPRVREAVDYVVDMDQAVRDIVEPAGVRQYSPFPPAVADQWDFPTDDWAEIPHEKDIGTAESRFEEAGVPTDYPWRIIVPPEDRREQLARRVASGLREGGFENVTVSRLEWGAFLGRYTSGLESDYNMYVIGWRHAPSPGAFTYPLFGRTPDVLGVTNGAYYGANSERGREAIRKLKQAGERFDVTRRRQLYTDAVTTILEDRAHLPAYNLLHSFGVKNRLEDLAVVPTDDKLHVFGETNNASLGGSSTGTA